MKLASVSVVVPTHERPNKLTRLLASLDTLSDYPKEVVVVSDSNDETTGSLLKNWRENSHRFEARSYLQSGGTGPAVSRNTGASYANGDIIAFIDDDCVAEPNWLSNLVHGIHLENGVVGVGGRVIPLRPSLISKYYSRYRILEPPDSLEYLVSANCCYSKDAMLNVGGFDEDISKPGGEDVGLSLKLSNSGWRFGFVSDAVVRHDFREGILDFCKTFSNYGRGCRTVTNKYGISQSEATGSYAAFGGYGYGSLAPSRIGPDELLREAYSTYKSAMKEGGIQQALAFPALRVLQRLSYYHGWMND